MVEESKINMIVPAAGRSRSIKATKQYKYYNTVIRATLDVWLVDHAPVMGG